MSDQPNGWAKVRDAHRPTQVSVRVPMRADLADELRSLEEQMQRERQIDAMENRIPAAPQIAARIRDIENELAASEVEFTFAGIGRRAYNRMLTEYPPTAEQVAQADADKLTLQFNPDTFPPALMAASCIAPEGATVEDMTAVWDEWSSGQAERLWRTCLAANLAVADVGPKSLTASVILGDSEPSSTTAPL